MILKKNIKKWYADNSKQGRKKKKCQKSDQQWQIFSDQWQKATITLNFNDLPGAPYGSGNQGGGNGGGGSDNESDQVKSLMELQQQGGIPGYGPYRKDIRPAAVGLFYSSILKNWIIRKHEEIFYA